MNNLISIIVPAYNQAKYLPEALESVLAQTYGHWECIIINDGSSDNTEEIALNYCLQDARFKYLKKENGGLSSARNAGLKAAKGSWIQFLDSDDYIQPEKFEFSIDLIINDPSASLIVSNFKMFIDDRSKTTAPFCELKQDRLNFEDILFNWDIDLNIPIHCGLFKASLFYQTPFIESLKACEDWIMWLQIFSNDVKAFYLDHPLAYYRNNPESMTKNSAFVRTNQIEAYRYIIQFIPDQYIRKFASNMFGGLRYQIINYENDLVFFKSRLPYRIEKKLMGFFKKRLLLKKPKS